ncbi:Meiosis-specific serine/threonine-protein kinase mek1, partial [Ceratobasidium sp. 395]
LEKTVGGYVITSHTLGTGNFAKVLLGHDPVRQRQVACKAIKTSKLEEVMKEVKILGTLDHPNINRVLGFQDAAPWTYIFLELSTGGDLFTYISSQGMLQEGEAKFLGYQLMLGLVYMHELNVSHRDLKPENVLIYAPRAYPRVQIADFGLAREKAHEPAFSAVGTIEYLPPEAILSLIGRSYEKSRRVSAPKKGYDGKKVDCWSLGVVIYLMLSGTHPFDYPEPSQRVQEGASQPSVSQGSLSQQSEAGAALVCDRILDGTIDLGFEPWSTLIDAKKLVRSLLVSAPERRMNVADALKHRWIQKDIERLKELYDQVTQ